MNNIFDKECIIEGNIITSGNLRIDGQFIGKLQSKSKVVVGPTSKVQGHITAKYAEISGRVKGNIQTEALLIVRNTAIIEGDLFTPKLVFEEGARFDGKCTMTNITYPRTPSNDQVKPVSAPTGRENGRS